MKHKFTFPSETTALREVRRWVKNVLQNNAPKEAPIPEMVLALDEACTNVIRHAYCGARGRPIRLGIECGPHRIRCEVRDYGVPCEPEKLPGRPKGRLTAGGWGLHIIREVFDEVRYEPCERGTRLILVWKTPRPDGNALA
jgi:serine/threonine-protein kinase RsbW